MLGLGETIRVSQSGFEQVRNGLMLSSYVQAESTEAATEIFKNHSHLQIPGATIEVTGAKQM